MSCAMYWLEAAWQGIHRLFHIGNGRFSGTYKICEQFPHLWPRTGGHAPCGSLVGALFVGVAPDCACASAEPQWRRCPGHEYFPCHRLEDPVVYLLSDLIVLVMSLSYIPVRRIGYSLFTVLLSGQLIGFVQNLTAHRRPVRIV